MVTLRYCGVAQYSLVGLRRNFGLSLDGIYTKRSIQTARGPVRMNDLVETFDRTAVPLWFSKAARTTRVRLLPCLNVRCDH